MSHSSALSYKQVNSEISPKTPVPSICTSTVLWTSQYTIILVLKIRSMKGILHRRKNTVLTLKLKVLYDI